MLTALGVFLIALGAVVAFAVDAAVPGVDLFLVGGLSMLAGAAAVAMSMMRWTPHRRVPVAPYRPTPVYAKSPARRTVRL